MALRIRQLSNGVEIAVKAVPGSSKDRIAGLLGDELKVAVSAPPEKGKANSSIESLLAAALRVSKRAVTVVSGHGNPRKRVFLEGVTVDQARAAFEQ